MLDLDIFRAQLAAGDEHTGAIFTLGTAWLHDGNSGTFRSWTDIAFLCKNCDGPIVLKGIQAVWDASYGHRTPAWTASLCRIIICTLSVGVPSCIM